MKRSKVLARLVNEANYFLKNSPVDQREARKAIHSLVSGTLLHANCYNGYRMLTAEFLPEGTPPGIVYDDGPEHNHQYPDDSRTSFY